MFTHFLSEFYLILCLDPFASRAAFPRAGKWISRKSEWTVSSDQIILLIMELDKEKKEGSKRRETVVISKWEGDVRGM